MYVMSIFEGEDSNPYKKTSQLNSKLKQPMFVM